MKKRILAIIAALLCLATLLVSCKKNEETAEDTATSTEPEVVVPETPLLKKVFNAQKFSVTNPTSVKELGKLGDEFNVSALNQDNNYVEWFDFFEKTEDGNKTYSVFSHSMGDVVLTLTNTADCEYSFAGDDEVSDYFYVYEKNITTGKYTTTLYDATGKAIATDTDGKSRINGASEYDDVNIYEGSYFTFANALCKLESYKKCYAITKVTDLPEYKTFDDTIFGASEKYLYNYCNYGFSIYDMSYNYVSSWEYDFTSSNVYDYNYFVMNDGTVLVQLQIMIPELSETYDIYERYKFNVHSYLVNPADGTAEEIELDYWVGYVEAANTIEGYYATGVENVATIAYFENGKWDETRSNVEVVMSNRAAVEFVYNDGSRYTSVQYNSNYGVFEGYNDTLEICAVLDENGKTLIEYDIYSSYPFDKYILTDNYIYDVTTGEIVYDLSDPKIDAEYWGDDFIIISKEIDDDSSSYYEYYLFKSGTATLIPIDRDAENYGYFSDNMYISETKDGKYIYYSFDMKPIYTSEKYLWSNTSGCIVTETGYSNYSLVYDSDGNYFLFK